MTQDNKRLTSSNHPEPLCEYTAIINAWHAYTGCKDAKNTPPPIFTKAFLEGFKDAEIRMRKALKGHSHSELWGDHGLIAATMRCVEALAEKEDTQ